MADPSRPHPATLTAQALGRVDPETRALTPAIHPSTTFERNPDLSYHNDRVYTRPDNPGYEPVETLLCALEDGAAARLFSSGMAAAMTVIQALSPGDHIVAPRVMYWGVRAFLQESAARWGVETSYVANGDLSALEAALIPGRTKLVWIETPANPDWQIQDIAAIAQRAHAVGAEVLCDNTVATPVLTRPLTLGADLVLHSATKYLNGHSDVLAGALVAGADTRLWPHIDRLHKTGGAVLGPFETWLLQRGMRTLYLRVERASANAMGLARHFDGHPELVSVLYPGLPDHPGHDIAKRQMDGGFGGMLSVRVKGGEARAVALQGHCQVFKRATSLGGVESLIEHRASVEGSDSPVTADLLRLSVGIEALGDLIGDLEAALAATANRGRNALL